MVLQYLLSDLKHDYGTIGITENNTQFHVNLIRYAIVQDNLKKRQCDLIFASIRLGRFPIDKHISGLEVKMNMLILGGKQTRKYSSLKEII